MKPEAVARQGAVAALCLLFGGFAASGAELEIDADPGQSGIQAERTVSLDETFEIVVRASGLAPGLNAYEFDLDLDESLLAIEQVSDSGLLPAPTRVVEQDGAGSDANLAVANTAGGVTQGSGELARIRLRALEVGSSPLRLGDVILSAPLGERLPLDAARPATLAIQVPEPGAAALGFAAFAALLALARRRRSRLGALAIAGTLAVSFDARAADDDLAPDVNRDGYVNILDVSVVAGCVGVDPATGPPCDGADLVVDGDIDALDVDAVIAAFGRVTGPPFAEAGPLFDCERDGYACDFSDTPDAVVTRIDVLAGQAIALLEGGASQGAAAAFLENEPDVAGVFREGHTTVFRIEGGPPVVLHDGAAARNAGGLRFPFSPADPSVPFYPGTEEPVGHRVVGRDRDADGRRDRAKRALILEPYAFDFDYDSGEVVRDVIQAIDDYETPDYFQDDDVTIDHYLAWDDYDLIFVSSHGEAISGEINGARLDHQWLSLGRFAPTCAGLREAARPAEPGAGLVRGLSCAWLNVADPGDPLDYRAVATADPQFFAQRYPQALENAFVWLDACRSARVSGLEAALVGKHSVYFGWDDYVIDAESLEAATRFFELAGEKGLRTSRAWEITCEEGECVDPTVEQSEDCTGEDPSVNAGCAWADADDDGDIDSDDVDEWKDGNEKPAELIYHFDGADQRVREVLRILDPDTLEPAGDDDSVLVKRTGAVLGDGLGSDTLGFVIELDGFESEDLTLPLDVDQFLRTVSLLTADRDGTELNFDFPLSTASVSPIGPSEDYRWRSDGPLLVFLGEDIEPGETMEFDLKLRLPPTLESIPIETGYSYAESLTHTFEACSFDASVSGAVAGSFAGTLASVSLGSDWQLILADPRGAGDPIPSFGFNANLRATRNGDQPGVVESLSFVAPGNPFPQAFGWNASIAAAHGLAPPTIFAAVVDGHITGTLTAQTADTASSEARFASLSVSFDADFSGPLSTPCVR